MKSTIRRRTMLTLACAVFGLPLPAEASITLCNRGEKTLEYVMVRNDWKFNANFVPYQQWYADGWYKLPPGCTTVIDEQKLLFAYFLIQKQVGERWQTMRFPIKETGLGKGASGTDRRFCVGSAKVWRRAQNLEDLAVCLKDQKLEVFSLYVTTDADTEHTVDLQ